MVSLLKQKKSFLVSGPQGSGKNLTETDFKHILQKAKTDLDDIGLKMNEEGLMDACSSLQRKREEPDFW